MSNESKAFSWKYVIDYVRDFVIKRFILPILDFTVSITLE
jgi:hypothetical protein